MGARWTQEERDLVEDKWGIWSVAVIAKTLNRSERAVVRFAEKNKLGSMYWSTYLSSEQIGSMFKVDPSTVVRYWIAQYGLKAIKKPLKKRRIYRVTLDDLFDWCYHNQDKWKATHLPDLIFGVEPDWLIAKRKQDKDILVAKRGTLWSVGELKSLKEMIDMGMTSREIAGELGRSLNSVRRQRQRLLSKTLNPPCY